MCELESYYWIQSLLSQSILISSGIQNNFLRNRFLQHCGAAVHQTFYLQVN